MYLNKKVMIVANNWRTLDIVATFMLQFGQLSNVAPSNIHVFLYE